MASLADFSADASAPPPDMTAPMQDGMDMMQLDGQDATVLAPEHPVDKLFRWADPQQTINIAAELDDGKLGEIETCVSELRTLAQPERIRQDIRERRFVEHTLQLAIQAALDVASHVVSDERLGEPRTNRELFDLLERGGWVAPELAPALRNMVGFRNVLVHGYDVVDLDVVADVLRNRLEDLLEFVAVIRRRLPAA